MSHTISITKTTQSSFSPKKIPREEFQRMVEDDPELEWIENSQVAVWPYGDDYLRVELNDGGTIDFGYRPHGDPELDEAFQKICAMAWRLNCFVEAEGGEILYDPAKDK